MTLSRREQMVLSLGVILGMVLLMLVGKARVSTPCVKAQANVEASDRLCAKLADQAAEANCSHLEGAQANQCRSMVLMLAKEGCREAMGYQMLKAEASERCL